MKLHQPARTILISTFGLVVSTLSAEAVTLTRLSSDHEMNALISDMAFVAEGRIGDNNGTATYELNLHESDPGDPQVTDQFNWVSGVAYPFELLYDAVSHFVEFTVGDRTLTYTYHNPFSDFFLRTRATQAGSSMLLSHLQLDGVSLDSKSHAVAETGGLDILRISDVAGSFQLLGKSTMTWEEITPVQSQLAFQIKLSEGNKTQEIPEPRLLVGLAVLSLMGITSRRLSEY